MDNPLPSATVPPQTGASPHPRYRLLGRLGRGGMGEVFRAHDRLTGQVVALKRVRLPEGSPAPAASPASARSQPRSPADPLAATEVQLTPMAHAKTSLDSTWAAPRHSTNWRSRTPQLAGTQPAATADARPPRVPTPSDDRAPPSAQRELRLHLAREFRTLAGLRHPHIVSVLDYGFDAAQQPYFTMELLDRAAPLNEAARSQPREMVLGFLLQILQALTYLHRRGVLHRDLKPGNILVVPTPDGPQVKVLDFGLALGTHDLRNAWAGIAGTLGYIAPELLLGAAPSVASDLFSVGVLAHELLVGSPPLGPLTTTALLNAAIAHAPPGVAEPSLGAALSAVLRRALSRDPGDRPADAAALSHDLAGAAGMPLPPESADIRESFLQAAPFHAREEELGSLLTALGCAADGQGRLVLIGGESGVGKSRLLDEFRAQALVLGARVLRGQAVQEGGGAFHVLRDVLAPLCIDQPLDPLSRGVLLPLVPRLPDLLGQPVEPAPDVDAKSAQERALAVIQQVLADATTPPQPPLVVILEDLQWAGAEVRRLLDRMGEICRRQSLLLLGTYRDDESPELPTALPHAESIKLRRFDKASVHQIVQAMLGPTTARPEIIERLHQETEGNAFFIVEVVREWAQAAGRLADVGAHGLPAQVLAGGVRAVLEGRLARVPAWAQGLLDAAAVAGRRIDLDVLRQLDGAAGGPPIAVEPWLRACADLSILEVSEHAWQFSHDKLREVLLAQVDARGERARLHRRIATALECAYPEAERGSHAASLAHHFGQAGDAGRAAHYGLRAGARSVHDGALEDAVDQLQATLRHQSRAATPMLEGVRARHLLATALIGLGRMQECAVVLLDLHAYVGHSLRPTDRGRVTALLRAVGILAGRRIMPWLRLRPDLPHPVVRELEHNFVHNSAALTFTGQPTDILLSTLQLYLLTTQAGIRDSRPMYTVTATFLLSLLPLGPLQRLGPQRPTDDPSVLADAVYFERMVLSAVNNGRAYWAQTEDICRRGIADAQAAGDTQRQSMFDVSRMYAALFTGRQADARDQADALIQRARAGRNTLFANHGIRCLATLDLLQGQPRAALQRLGPMHHDAVRTGDALGVLDGVGLLARASLMAGDTAAAREWAEQALAITRHSPLSGFGGLEGYLAPPEVLVALAHREGDPDQRQVLTRLSAQALLLAWYYAWTFPIGLPRAWMASGLYARLRGHPWLAQQCLARALANAQELAMPHDAQRALAALTGAWG